MSVTLKWNSDNGSYLSKAYSADAGYDLVFGNDVTVRYMVGIIDTDLRVQLPEGYVGLLLPRSSTFIKGLHIIPGVIDAGYCGYLKIQYECWVDSLTIPANSAIAQLVVLPLPIVELAHVNSFDLTERGTNGLGSTIK